MQLNREPIRLAHQGDDAGPADPDRTAAVLTLTGSAITVVAAILPWGEKAIFGFSLTTAGGEDARIVLAALAVASAAVGGTVLLKRRAPAAIALVLVGLAVAQLGAGTWFAVIVVNEIRAADPHLVFITAIGTGLYLVGLGSACTLIGSILAWTKRQT